MRMLRGLALGLVTTLAVVAAQPAKAGILLEPYLGYQIGKYTISGSPDANFNISTAALGARLGVTFPLLFIAADYSLPIGGSMKQDDAFSTKWDLSGSQLFVEVGANLPLIRAFVGYGLMNTLEGKQNGFDIKAENGTAIKAGVGTSILPMIALNLEYIYSKYDKVNGDSTTKSNSNVFMLDLSVPFDL